MLMWYKKRNPFYISRNKADDIGNDFSVTLWYFKKIYSEQNM